ncbi:MAG TPA: phosphatase PAP2 family protein [Sphingomicrobium sp.]|nr:phosphatase PAP2 family protein [Sphingomicrobium sp.]
MNNIDVGATQAINQLAGRSSLLDFCMVGVSAVAVPLLILTVALQWWRRRDRLHVRHVLVAAGLSFLLGLALNQVVLLFVQRQRPYNAGLTHLLIATSTDPSFPSDHATASAAIAFAFLLHGMRREGLWFSAAALVVIFSRVYIGTHYVSDVFGGALTALVAAALVKLLYREGRPVDRVITRIF